MLSLKSIENIANLLWPQFDTQVNWEEVLGYHLLTDNAMVHFEDVAIHVISEKIGRADVDISTQLANDIVNQLTFLAIKESKRIYHSGKSNGTPA